MHNILLLFNLAIVQSQISEQSRYPFDKHFQAVKSKWSLEHIHAQNEKPANWDDNKIKFIQESLIRIIPNSRNKLDRETDEDFKKRLKSLAEMLTSDSIQDESKNVYKSVMAAFMGKTFRIDEKGVCRDVDFDKDDSIKNLALLQGDKNAQLNNKLYPEKREFIARYEGGDENDLLFVPLATRNVFFKHYSPSSINPLLWDDEAGTDYLNMIVETLAKYLDLDELRDGDNKIGLKRK